MFLGDGDPLVLSNRRLVPILRKLKELLDEGLSLLYIGIESGDNETLKAIQKGESFESIEEGLLKAQKIGFRQSITIINGVGGKAYSHPSMANLRPDFLRGF